MRRDWGPPAAAVQSAPRCELCQAQACYGLGPPAVPRQLWRCRAHVWPQFLPADRVEIAAAPAAPLAAAEPALPASEPAAPGKPRKRGQAAPDQPGLF